MRILAWAFLAALATMPSASAGSGSTEGSTGGMAGAPPPAIAVGSGETAAAPCGCAGPKSYYLKKYGTIKPPGLGPGGPLPAPVNPPATGAGG